MHARILVISLSFLAASAHASFELLLVADNGSNTYATRTIHRFDPVSGAYLGKFGGFNSDISSTYLDKANNSLYVIAGNETSKWNYNTGEMLGSFAYTSANSFSAVRPSGDRAAFFISGSNVQLYGFPTAGSGIGTPTVSGALFSTGLWTSNTSFVAFDFNQTRMANFNTNASGTVATLGVITPAIGLTNGFGQMCVNGGTSELIMAGGNSGLSRVYVPGASALATGIPTTANTMSAASAHFGFFLGMNDGTTGRIEYYSQFRNLTRTFGTGTVLRPISMQTVLAPEPGSMAVLGLGLVALLKRRKN
ncbi:MAG: PEP-CTERM sorting domain-containing protein [Armatimonadetes bacterium]|nr:PEP-CTERM sorting domain-containing protein [Armatimonadota bacterium]